LTETERKEYQAIVLPVIIAAGVMITRAVGNECFLFVADLSFSSLPLRF
jgi:hypothetical protein